jgi:hypothetical protein
MPDETDTTPQQEQPETPAVEAEQSPAPETAEEKTEAQAQGEEARPFDSQGAYTKFTQRVSQRFQSLEDKIDRILSASSAGTSGEQPASEPEIPQLDATLAKSRLLREMREENQKLKKSVAYVSEVAASQALISQYPDLKEDLPTFIGWVKEVPGRAAAIESGIFSEKAAMAAFRAEHPAKRGKGAIAQPKVPARVETASVPRGVIRDIRDKLREQGVTGKVSSEAAFDTAVTEARRELKAAE